MASKALFAFGIVFAVLGCIVLIASMASTNWISGCLDYASLGKMMAGLGPSRQARDLSSFEDSIKNGLSNLGNTDLSSLGDSIKNGLSNLGNTDLSGLGDSIKNGLSNLGNTDLSSLQDSIKNGLSNLGNTANREQQPVHADVPYTGSRFGMSNPFGGLGNMKMCLDRGFFRMSSDMYGAGSSIPIPVSSIAKATLFGFAALAIAILCGVASAIVLITAAAGNIESYEGKGRAANRARVGIILLAVCGTFGLAGMIACTVEDVGNLKNPMKFISQLMSSVGDVMNRMMPDSGIRMPDFSGLTKNTSGVMGQAMSSFFKLHVGYALYLGWVGVAFMLIALILSVMAKQTLISQPYARADTVKL